MSKEEFSNSKEKLPGLVDGNEMLFEGVHLGGTPSKDELEALEKKKTFGGFPGGRNENDLMRVSGTDSMMGGGDISLNAPPRRGGTRNNGGGRQVNAARATENNGTAPGLPGPPAVSKLRGKPDVFEDDTDKCFRQMFDKNTLR